MDIELIYKELRKMAAFNLTFTDPGETAVSENIQQNTGGNGRGKTKPVHIEVTGIPSRAMHVWLGPVTTEVRFATVGDDKLYDISERGEVGSFRVMGLQSPFTEETINGTVGNMAGVGGEVTMSKIDYFADGVPLSSTGQFHVLSSREARRLTSLIQQTLDKIETPLREQFASQISVV